MGERKEIKISLTTFCLVIAIILIVIMGAFMYNQKIEADRKITELQVAIKELQENKDNNDSTTNIENKENADNKENLTQEDKNKDSEDNKNETLTENEIYKKILDDYKNALVEFRNNTEMDFMDLEKKYEINSRIMIPIVIYNQDKNMKIHYTFYDIDKNGVKELLVGIGPTEIGAIYSYNPNTKEIKKIYYLGTLERGNLNIYDNGIIFSSHSGGAYLHSYEFGKIGQDGYSYYEIEDITEEYFGEDSAPVYTDSKTNKELKYKSINEIKDKYLKNAKELELGDWSEIE